jgi:geranylgeranyl reductase family protein
MYDIIVVGAGPAGCRTAELIAKKGYEVLVFEEHSQIGKPVQCTGLVSRRIGKLPKEIVINKIKKARFYSGKEYFEAKSKHFVNVIDREGYDKYLAKRAKAKGVKFKLGTRFLDFKNDIVKINRGVYETKILVGADGPNSSVAKSVGLKLTNNILFAMQSTVEGNFESDTVELHFGSKASPGLFAWVVPENEETARVGLMVDRNPNKYFEKFLTKRIGKVKRKNAFGDIIRYGLIACSASERVLLVGDAACQIKPFSAGGIVYGQIGAKYAAEACIKALETNDFSKNFLLNNYDKKWKKELEGPIKKGLLFKKIFSKISDSHYSFSLVKKLGISKLSSFFDMDFLGKS